MSGLAEADFAHTWDVPFSAGDRVITPSNRVGVISALHGEFATGCYVDGWPADAAFELHAKYLAVWPVGMPRPWPVLVGRG